jgi:hypothetical protein
VQLLHSVNPELQFRQYSYRSSVTQTMRDHLNGLAGEAAEMLSGRQGQVCTAPRVLDVGGNDGWTLHCLPYAVCGRVLIDPSDVEVAYDGITKIHGFFPQDLLLNRQFDLVLSVACFYDARTPREWATAVKKVLAPDGLWVVEVADLKAVLDNVAFDYFVAEHEGLHSLATLLDVLRKTGLKVVRASKNACNGGSVRAYVTHSNSAAYDRPDWQASVGDLWSEGKALAGDTAAFSEFSRRARAAVGQLRDFLARCKADGKLVHILGASTKGNVVWQAAGLTTDLVPAASDRDPLKAGRRLPGTGIPVISEEESRAAGPAVYLSALSHFRDELVARERPFLAAGGHIAFPLPQLSLFSFAGPANPSPLPGWEAGRRE